MRYGDVSPDFQRTVRAGCIRRRRQALTMNLQHDSAACIVARDAVLARFSAESFVSVPIFLKAQRGARPCSKRGALNGLQRSSSMQRRSAREGDSSGNRKSQSCPAWRLLTVAPIRSQPRRSARALVLGHFAAMCLRARRFSVNAGRKGALTRYSSRKLCAASSIRRKKSLRYGAITRAPWEARSAKRCVSGKAKTGWNSPSIFRIRQRVER